MAIQPKFATTATSRLPTIKIVLGQGMKQILARESTNHPIQEMDRKAILPQSVISQITTSEIQMCAIRVASCS